MARGDQVFGCSRPQENTKKETNQFCRKLLFWGQMPHIGHEFNGLQTPKLSEKYICDRIGRTGVSKTRPYQRGTGTDHKEVAIKNSPLQCLSQTDPVNYDQQWRERFHENATH